MKFTFASLLFLFEIIDLFSCQAEAFSRENSYQLDTVLGKRSRHTYHVDPFQELSTYPTRRPIYLEPKEQSITPKIKKKKKKLKRKNRRKNHQLQPKTTTKNDKKMVINKKIKREHRKKGKTSSRNKNQRAASYFPSEIVTRRYFSSVPNRKPVDITVHIKMDGMDDDYN